MRVFVYWNLNRDCYSVRALEGADKGKVIAHSAAVELADVSFPVAQAARLKIVAGEHKSVHAGMRGRLVSLSPVAADGMRAITYNPRKYASFVTRDNEAPINSAACAIGLTVNGRAQCFAII